MELDTLRIAIAVSSASLTVALLIGWLHARKESFLLHGAAGIAALVTGLTLLGLRGPTFQAEAQVLPFSLLLAGMACAYSCTRRFRNRAASITPCLVLAAGSIVLTITPLFSGYTGVAGMMLNISCGVFFALCAYESFEARNESSLPLVTNATLYAVTGFSFFCCAFMTVQERTWVIIEAPVNWAESFNTVMCLISMTAIGAITLTLHHARSAAHHENQANTDSLTGVLNRRALFNRLGGDRTCEGLGVLMLDLDHFKQINDHFGHAHGDDVLIKFTAVLKEHLRSDDIIARLGGEEFCVVLPGQDQDSAELIADRIRRAYAAQRIKIDNEGNYSTVSIGIAIGLPNEGFSSALSRADNALYTAKRSGRNQVQTASLRLVA